MKAYTIETSKEALKFSAAHMATFSDGSPERLHGHNYQVRAELSGLLDAAGMVLDVGVLKQWVRALCDELDERVLIALRNPMIQVTETDGQVHLRCKEKSYSIPAEDCVLLPLENTTMEYLAHYVAERLFEQVQREPGAERMSRLRVWVSETSGQSASWTLDVQTEKGSVLGRGVT